MSSLHPASYCQSAKVSNAAAVSAAEDRTGDGDKENISSLPGISCNHLQNSLSSHRRQHLGRQRWQSKLSRARDRVGNRDYPAVKGLNRIAQNLELPLLSPMSPLFSYGYVVIHRHNFGFADIPLPT